MSSPFVSFSPILALVGALLLDGAAGPLSPPDAPAPDARAVEVQRIRAHFDSVLTELPSHDLSARSPAQRASRDRLLGTLRAYRDAGAFPHNYDFPDRPTPYFIDRKTGVLCAVAHLLASTGRRDIVDRVAAADNNVWVPQLAGDTAFVHWLSDNGLTLAEAARIQVPYMGPTPDVGPAIQNDRGSAYVIGSAAAIGGSIATSLWSTRGNADGHRGLSNIAGFGVSAASLGLVVAGAFDRAAPRPAVTASLLAAGMSAYFSTRGLLRHSAYRTAQRDAARRAPVGASIAPILPVAGVSGSGLAVRLTF
ncbi:MAG: hypothetical protein IT355_18010 [Gemmatimonadaceae bacterium]|nr:hypothetical protein [Gemmatimonadaceae bacterium]